MPDVELKPQVYKDERPKEYFEEFHARVREREPDAVYEAVRVITLLHALITYRARAIGSENVPSGPAILAPNHASFMDHFFTAVFVRRRVQFMGKSQMFNHGPLGWIYSHGGVFPVRRGQHDVEAFATSFKVLERDGPVVMYCEGGRSRTGAIGEAKPGIGRLALESGVPVVPVAILGSYQVRNWKRLQFPKVIVQYGKPLRFEQIGQPTREQQQEAAELILERIKQLHSELQRLGARNALRAARERADLAKPAGSGVQ